MVSKKTNWSDQELSSRIDAGIKLAYERLVQREAKEGGYLILSVDGKPTRVPAVDLLKKLKKSA